VPSLEAAKSALQSQVRFYQEREAFFAKALRVTDGGQYRNDWPSAIERVLCENEALRAQVAAHEDADRRWSADMEALRRELQEERDCRAQMIADRDARSGEPPVTPRDQAALAVAHAEAALLDARKALREAVKAEIAAMPSVPQSGVLLVVRDVLSTILGAPEWVDDPDFGNARWSVGDGQITLLDEHMDSPMTMEVESTFSGKWAEVSIPVGTLDSSIRHALTWLADRDVFVEVRK
jgi:hypothetical protein